MATLSGVLVYQYFTGPDGIGIPDVICRASILDTPYNDNTVAYTNRQEAVQNTTNISGLVEWIFPVGSTIHVYCREADFEYIKIVPSGLTRRLITDLGDA